MKRWVVLLWLVLAPAALAQVHDIPLPPIEARDADVQVLLVRHAYPACSDLQCALNEEGYQQARELARYAANARGVGLVLDGVFASSACRTILTVTPTANDARLPIYSFPARDELGVCGYLGPAAELVRPNPDLHPDNGLSYAVAPAATRSALMAFIAEKARTTAQRGHFYVIADHSNFVCLWFRTLGVPSEDYDHDCINEGDLSQTDYADIYWLYDSAPGPAVAWRLRHFENAFDRGIPNAYEQQPTELSPLPPARLCAQRAGPFASFNG